MFGILARETTLSFDESFADDLAKESWTMYGLGMLFITLRMIARIRRNGIRQLAADDYLMLLAACWYTLLIICLNVIARGGGSNLYPPEQFSTFSAEEIQERIEGSKIVVVSEQAMLNLIYTLKLCMLCIYSRLTVHLRHQTFIKLLSVYVALGYVGTQFAFFFACRPFQGYWAMPPPNPQCTTLEHYAQAQACFNISSDAFMLAISLPMFINTTLPAKQKIVLTGIFGMGLFVILAAILTKVFNLADVYSTVYMLWYVRESSVAVWVTNLPLIWPLMREIFPILRSFTPGQKPYSGSRSRSRALNLKAYGPTSSGIGVKTSTHISVVDRDISSGGGGGVYQMQDLGRKKRGVTQSTISVDSDERELNGKYIGGIAGGMTTTTTVEIEDRGFRTLDEGDVDRLRGWDHEPDDGLGYSVHIRGGGDRGDSIVGHPGDTIGQQVQHGSGKSF